MLAWNDQSGERRTDHLPIPDIEQGCRHRIDEQNCSRRIGDDQSGIGVVDNGLGVGILNGLSGVAKDFQGRRHFPDFVIPGGGKSVGQISGRNRLHPDAEFVEPGNDIATDIKPEHRCRGQKAEQAH